MFKNLKRKIGSVLVALIIATFFMSSNAFAYKGIDVSMHNGYINFNEVKANNVTSVIIKATEGVSYKDNRLEQHYNGARSAGIQHIGFYHFFSESSDPSQQARDFWNAIKDKQYDIIPCLDVETNSWGRSSYDLTNRCLEFVQTFEAISGQKVMLYSGAYFSRDELDSRIKSLPLWVASYGRSPIATGFENVVGWQFTETGEIGGVNGYCDVNDFNDGMLLSNSGYVANPSFSANIEDYSSNPVEQAREFVSDRALELQQKLNIFGNYGLAEDSIFGIKTYEALGDAQSKLGIATDHLAGSITFSKLDEAIANKNQSSYSNSSSDWVRRLQTQIVNQDFGNIAIDNQAGSQTLGHLPLIKQGTRGEITRLLQEKLNSLGYDCGECDSIYGNRTAMAVYRYQIDNNLIGDKITGRRTWSKLLSLS